MEGQQTAEWADGTRGHHHHMLSSHPLRGSNINWTNVLSCMPVPLFAGDQWHRDTVHSRLPPVHLNFNWGPISGAAAEVWARPALSDGEVMRWDDSRGNREPLNRASSCSPGPVVTRSLFDVVRLRGLALIVSASGGDATAHAPHYNTKILISHLIPPLFILSYETTQEPKTPRATSHCT